MKDTNFLFNEEDMPSKKVISLQFLEQDVSNILELLAWTQDTAEYLSVQASVKNNSKTISKLVTYSTNANILISYIMKSMNIGEPDSDSIN